MNVRQEGAALPPDSAERLGLSGKVTIEYPETMPRPARRRSLVIRFKRMSVSQRLTARCGGKAAV